MTTARMDDRLPLLHKYVLQPQDDLQLVLTKLNYRLCVKEVSKVIYRRSMGASISEAVDLLEWIPETTSTPSKMNGHHEVEPLILPAEGPHCLSSPKAFSPDDSYCGTMKSDDSGIVMDDSHMNFSGDQSDLMFSSAEVSPLEEDNHILNGIQTSYLSDITESSITPLNVSQTQSDTEKEDQVKEFFKGNEEICESEDLQTTTEINEEEVPAEQHTEDQSEPESDDMSAADDNLPNEDTEDINEDSNEEEEERVDFVKDFVAETGMKCDDVCTALQILRTRYRLSDTTMRKFIITFSSWNVSQISHPISNRCSWWDESLHEPSDNTEIEDLTEDIYTKQGEISELVDRIMEEEQLKHNLARKLKEQEEEEEQPLVDDVIEPAESPLAQTVPDDNKEDEIEDAELVNQPEDEPSTDKDSKNNKKKHRSALQRFVHALRKRMTRNRSPSEKDRVKS